jgi:CRISPR-associated protein Cas1
VGILAQITFALPSLTDAWEAVHSNDMSDGVLSPGLARWKEDAEQHLAELADLLAADAYRPRPLTPVPIPKPDGSQRVLHVPAVTDRVVARAVLQAITPLVDPYLGHAAFAYRPGLGVADAVDAVVAMREEGLDWVLRSDVDDCFPTVPVRAVRRRLGALVDDGELLRVVDLLLARPARAAKGRLRPVRGLPQGCALSPILSNLVLVDLDDRLADDGFPVVRYADDLVVGAETPDGAWEAARRASEVLEGMGMSLGSDKTAVMSFEQGFSFLGEDFGPRYPPPLSARIDEPDRKVVYAAVQGSGVRVAKGRMVIESPSDVQLLNVPVSHVERLVLFGAVGLSAGARSWAMGTGVQVVFASRRGVYQGTLVAADAGSRVSRLRRQLAVSGHPDALPLARSIVSAKITKQVTLLRRLTSGQTATQVAEAVSSMRGLERMVGGCTAVDEVMGLEGAAAAAYFPALGLLMPEALRFTERSKRPPRDLVNASLSFLYTILLGECVTALHAAGLDPALGLLHADRDRRPSLALDLQEEFRPLVVDQVVAEAARQGRLRPEHARTDPASVGVELTRAGREVLLAGYERRMLRTTRGALPDFAGSWRRHLYRQAQRLRASIFDPGTPWTGLSWRP